MEYEALQNTPWVTGTFWVFVAVAIFAALAGRKVLAAIGAMLDARTEAVKAALAEAAQLKAEAEAMLADAKAKQAQAALDAKQILETARIEAVSLAAAMAAEAEAAAQRREHMAVERIKAAETAALKEVRSVAIDVATQAAARVLGQTLTPHGDAALVDHAIAKTPDALRA
ncbi:F0F1 ATP synthase subunit B [Acidocella sp.]|uniref:F0F1 ATP synthase subunit B family protein n=1 Tax=Acidocella sp. TaxID=50710 RepID=UPI002639F9E2|nr:F0F1 ATP synthase subunit B [Acidocella sp.]